MKLIKDKQFRVLASRGLAFLFILFLVDFTIGGLIRKAYFSTWNKYTYGIEETTADIIIVGSSRAQNHYVPSVFWDSLGLTCFNMGSGGQNVFYDFGVVKSILDRYNPKIVIMDLLDIDIQVSSDTHNTDKLNILLPYYKDNEGIKEVVYLRGPLERLKLVSRIYPFNSQITNILYSYIKKERNPHFARNGFIPLNGQMEYSGDVTKKEGSREIEGRKAFDTLKTLYFDKVIYSCKSQGVRLIIVISPWFQGLPTNSNFESFYKDISNKYGIEFWDYSRDNQFLSKPFFFTDKGHLNGDGAVLFTKLLSNRIKLST